MRHPAPKAIAADLAGTVVLLYRESKSGDYGIGLQNNHSRPDIIVFITATSYPRYNLQDYVVSPAQASQYVIPTATTDGQPTTT